MTRPVECRLTNNNLSINLSIYLCINRIIPSNLEGNVVDPPPLSSDSDAESNWATWILVPVVVVLLGIGLLLMLVKYKRTSGKFIF